MLLIGTGPLRLTSIHATQFNTLTIMVEKLRCDKQQWNCCALYSQNNNPINKHSLWLYAGKYERLLIKGQFSRK